MVEKRTYSTHLTVSEVKDLSAQIHSLPTKTLDLLARFLATTIAYADFSDKKGEYDPAGLMSREIPPSKYLEEGLDRNMTETARDWILKNTPIRSIGSRRRLSFGRFPQPQGVSLSFDDCSVAKDVFEVVESEKRARRKELRFENGVLHIRGNEIVLVKQKKQTDESTLLDTLFSDRRKVWENDELADAFGYRRDKRVPDYSKTDRFYQIAKTISEKMERAGYEDFLLFSTKNVGINPAYLDE